MRWMVPTALLFASSAGWAQGNPGGFTPGDLPETSVPEAPPPLSARPLPEPTAPAAREPSQALPAPSPPAPPRWINATVSAVGLLSGLRDLYLGVELSGGGVIGLSGPRLEGEDRRVSGWLLLVGGELLGGRVFGPLCAGTDFCGQRWAAGAGVRAGHATGFAATDGRVSIRRLWFAGLSAQVAFVSVPPAPLVAGSRWVEGVFRLKAGLEGNVQRSGPPTSRNPGARLQAFVFGELITFAPVPRGFQVGAAIGVGW